MCYIRHLRVRLFEGRPLSASYRTTRHTIAGGLVGIIFLGSVRGKVPGRSTERCRTGLRKCAGQVRGKVPDRSAERQKISVETDLLTLTSSQMYSPGRKCVSMSAFDTRRFCSMDRGENIGTRCTACPSVRCTAERKMYGSTQRSGGHTQTAVVRDCLAWRERWFTPLPPTPSMN